MTDEDDPQMVKRLMEEVFLSARIWGWLAAAIALVATVAGLILRWREQYGEAAFCLLVAAIMAMTAIANLVFAWKLGPEISVDEDKPSQEEPDGQAGTD